MRWSEPGAVATGSDIQHLVKPQPRLVEIEDPVATALGYCSERPNLFTLTSFLASWSFDQPW
ncbi:hypothetical protein BH18ACI4_BH18ACI4_15330 [soil metagenome]